MNGDATLYPLTGHHLVFQPSPRNGSRYDLVLVEDPYGGTLVIWRDAKMTWRYHRNDRMKPLSKDCNFYDGQAIFDYLENLPILGSSQ